MAVSILNALHMRKIITGLLAVSVIMTYSSCKKQTVAEEQQQAPAASNETGKGASTFACSTKYLDLVIDPATGGSFLYKIDNSPSNPPVAVTTINGSAGNNQIGSSLPATTVTKMTGLSYDPATGVCYGITGAGGSHPNSLIKFSLADPNVVGITPLISPGLIDLSDIERNPATGRYYAINRVAAGNNSVVIVDVTTASVIFLPLTTGLNLRGLAVDPGGKLYVMRMTGTSGSVYVVDPGTGGVILGPCPYGVVIAPGVFAPNAEMGLHFDDVCTNFFITGNFVGTSFRLTDALPACFGGPIPPSIPVPIKPTVDFSRLN
jgi:DNA-binding beta-propeller fold protein YncE